MLVRDSDTCCVLDSSLQFLYCNPAWDDFARSNGGTESVLAHSLMHKRLLTYIPEIIKPFFVEHFNALRAGGGIWRHRYECSSPTDFRMFEMQAVRLWDENEILICHILKINRPHDRTPIDPPPRRLGQVHICCHCRRTLRQDDSGIWDWIPAYLTDPPADRADDLCPPCAENYREGFEPRLSP